MRSVVPETGLSAQAFPADDNRCQQSHLTHEPVCEPEPIRRRPLHIVLNFWRSYFCMCWNCAIFIVGHLSCCVAVSYIYVVEPCFLLYVQHKLQHFLVNGFHLLSINSYPDVCCMQFRKTITQHGRVIVFL
jgi:hypothetical protein